jgi:hypothetical protein
MAGCTLRRTDRCFVERIDLDPSGLDLFHDGTVGQDHRGRAYYRAPCSLWSAPSGPRRPARAVKWVVPRMWFNGRTRDSQARDGGSIPLIRSKRLIRELPRSRLAQAVATVPPDHRRPGPFDRPRDPSMEGAVGQRSWSGQKPHAGRPALQIVRPSRISPTCMRTRRREGTNSSMTA